ncbi:hydroxyisourate hydrolase [Phenylobacterium aquaticum]|uniref:hydroxyisourate hydrolase n=1 Tax=Phenylobacterium aquaticum TaxID=1763816 RepID=UPI001F5C7FDA|nr:hydroxyisourate hydrolase [Phenylobacterium aquaticum]MCI3135514.1 hydroxyisourate hydrolase [Phenylobacterium aquaticum]
MAGQLTTHALDTVRGAGAAGLKVTLYRLDPAPVFVAEVILDDRGRGVVLQDGLTVGAYELVFAAAAYHRATGAVIADPPFLDEVPIRFGVAEPDGHYHVPLLLTPYSYSTYRGG